MQSAEEISNAAQLAISSWKTNLASNIIYDIGKAKTTSTPDGGRRVGRFLKLNIRLRQPNGKTKNIISQTIHEFSTSELEPDETTIKQAEANLRGQSAPTLPAAPAAPSAAETNLRNQSAPILPAAPAAPSAAAVGSTTVITLSPPSGGVELQPPTPSPAPFLELKKPEELLLLADFDKNRLRKESQNALEMVAFQKGTQFNYRLPDGSIIRAGIDPAAAATINTEGIVAGTIASPIPAEIYNEAVKQLHEAGLYLNKELI